MQEEVMQACYLLRGSSAHQPEMTAPAHCGKADPSDPALMISATAPLLLRHSEQLTLCARIIAGLVDNLSGPESQDSLQAILAAAAAASPSEAAEAVVMAFLEGL